MLISDSRQFIFVLIRKAASSSIQSMLAPHAPEPQRGRLLHLGSRAGLVRDYRKHAFRTHDPILAARRRMPADRFERYFKFSVVRNPWDRLVSEYEYILSRPEHGRHARVARQGGFEGFVRMQIPRKDAYQANMLCDGSGTLLMDFCGRFESLDEDWRTICSRLDIPHRELPRRNTTRHRHYRDYYTASLRELVAQHWRRDIALFGYTFADEGT
jgi:hypothetical protein